VSRADNVDPEGTADIGDARRCLSLRFVTCGGHCAVTPGRALTSGHKPAPGSSAARSDGKWRVFPYALGTVDPVGSAQFGQQITVLRTKGVHVNRLDDVLGSCLAHIDNPRIYLKLDTQRSDADVFAGADGVLDKMSALQTEINFPKIYLGMQDVFDALPGFMATGFEVAECMVSNVRRSSHQLVKPPV
jgi:hypothetical protein